MGYVKTHLITRTNHAPDRSHSGEKVIFIGILVVYLFAVVSRAPNTVLFHFYRLYVRCRGVFSTTKIVGGWNLCPFRNEGLPYNPPLEIITT